MQSDFSTETLRASLTRPDFPRSNVYDPHWLLDNAMGPHVLWLAEWVCQKLDLRPGMRVLDLGCGRACSSVFLAREFGCTVFAADLWIKPTDNLKRIEAAGLADRVIPLHCEAHALPFPDAYFDAVVSLDAYHYFGTDDLYLGYVTRFLRPSGTLAIAAPALTHDLPETPPAHLRDYWEWEFCSFHTTDWWRRHWSKTGLVTVSHAEVLPDGWRLWQDFFDLRASLTPDPAARTAFRREADMLRLDAGRTLTFARVVARKP